MSAGIQAILGSHGKLDDVVEIGNGGDLVFVRLLAETVERVAGIALGAVRHVLEMIERHDLALLHAVNVDIGADAIFHALGAQLFLSLLDLVASCTSIEVSPSRVSTRVQLAVAK